MKQHPKPSETPKEVHHELDAFWVNAAAAMAAGQRGVMACAIVVVDIQGQIHHGLHATNGAAARVLAGQLPMLAAEAQAVAARGGW